MTAGRFLNLRSLILAILVALGSSGASAQGLIPRDDYWITDGDVIAIARAQGKLFVGGNFKYVGPFTGSFAVLDKTTGAVSLDLPKTSGTIDKILPDGAGGWFIAGDFTSLDGVLRIHLAHIRADGSLDPAWHPQPDGGIDDMAIGNGVVYVCGGFSAISGVARDEVAALNATTGAVLPWNPQPDGSVDVIGLDGLTLYVVGNFGQIAGQSREELAAFNTSTGALTSWAPAGGVSGTVYSLAFSDSLVYLAGNINSIGGVIRRETGALRKSDGSLSPWNPNVVGTSMSQVFLKNGIAYLGGQFDSIGGQYRKNLAAVNAGTAAPTAWVQNGIAYAISSLLASDDELYVGWAGTIDTPARSSLASLSLTSGAFTSWGPLVEEANEVRFIAEDAGHVIIGGNFRSASGVSRRNLAALDEATGVVLGWNPRPYGTVASLAISPDSLVVYAGGQWDSISGIANLNAAAYDVASLSINGWRPLVGAVYAILIDGSRIFLAGLNTIKSVNATTGGALAFNPVVNASVYGVAVAGDTAYVAGSFTTIAGTSRRGLAALNASTGALYPWDPMGASGTGQFKDVEVYGGAVYVGGRTVGTIGGASRTLMSAVDRFTGLATSFNPTFVAGTNEVTEIMFTGGKVYAGGTFTSGTTRNLAAFNPASGVRDAWNPSPAGSVLAMLPSPTTFFAGGSFNTIGSAQPDYGVPNLALFAASATSVESGEPAHATSSVGSFIQNAPNPFRGSTDIRFDLPAEGFARLTIYDVRGRQVRELHRGILTPGRHAVSWDGTDEHGRRAARGVYFASLESGGLARTVKLSLTR